jgi:hypothetical protein
MHQSIQILLLLLLQIIRKTPLICLTDLVLAQRVFATTARKDSNAKSEGERVGEEIMTLAETKNIPSEDAEEEHPPVQEVIAIIISTTIPEIITIIVEAMIVELLTNLVLLHLILLQTCHPPRLTLHWIHAVRRIHHRIHTMIREGHIHLPQSMMRDETIRLIRQGILMIIIAEEGVMILETYLLHFLGRHHRQYLPRTKH